jgi:phospholipase C
VISELGPGSAAMAPGALAPIGFANEPDEAPVQNNIAPRGSVDFEEDVPSAPLPPSAGVNAPSTTASSPEFSPVPSGAANMQGALIAIAVAAAVAPFL